MLLHKTRINVLRSRSSQQDDPTHEILIDEEPRFHESWLMS